MQSFLKEKKRVKAKGKKWYDSDLTRLKKSVDEKAFLMLKLPKDPMVRGSLFKLNKKYAKTRKKKKKKKREFKQNILTRLDELVK